MGSTKLEIAVIPVLLESEAGDTTITYSYVPHLQDRRTRVTV
jgi:hypothetical protein